MTETRSFLDMADFVEDTAAHSADEQRDTVHPRLERAQQARIAELERQRDELQVMYDRAAADLIDALDRASAYSATASTLHQEIERRNGVERRENRGIYLNRETTSNSLRVRTASKDRRESWPR